MGYDGIVEGVEMGGPHRLLVTYIMHFAIEAVPEIAIGVVVAIRAVICVR
jgi:hypothetical protein